MPEPLDEQQPAGSSGGGAGAGPGPGPALPWAAASAAASPGLSELLKLKCSLRQAMRMQGVQPLQLILSLLAHLPMTAGLLLDSQVGALVAPLRRHGSAEVADAARCVHAWLGGLAAGVGGTRRRAWAGWLAWWARCRSAQRRGGACAQRSALMSCCWALCCRAERQPRG